MARASRKLLRRCRTAAAAERGSAIVEFIFAATILLIPMIYLVLAAAALEGGSYAVVSAADQAAKVFAVSENPAQARSNAQAAADRAQRWATTTFGRDAFARAVSAGLSQGSRA